jgi:uncharacterized protein with HEPN domain
MEVEIKAWLYDVLNAIHEIESFTTDLKEDFKAFQNDLKTRRAVERNIEIIGEAMNRVLQRIEINNFSNARKIVDTRNRIIHGYDSVSDEIVWSIVIVHLPILKIETEILLSEH